VTQDGTSGGLRLLSNIVAGNKLGAVSLAGSSNAYRANAGLVTENSVTASITSGATSIAVSHGLGITPATGQIQCTPTGSLYSAAYWYVDTITSSQFTLHVNAAPSGGTANFGCTAQIVP
jgi:hypothetical protein